MANYIHDEYLPVVGVWGVNILRMITSLAFRLAVCFGRLLSLIVIVATYNAMDTQENSADLPSRLHDVNILA